MPNNKQYHSDIQKLRQRGFTYSEINTMLNLAIPKSSLSYICRAIRLTPAQIERIEKEASDRLEKNRKKAVLSNRLKHDAKLEGYR